MIALGKLLTDRFRHSPLVSGEILSEELMRGTFASDRSIDPMSEVIVSVGGCGALSVAFRALIEPGEEVLLLEPAPASYVSQIEAAGGIPVRVPLRPPNVSSFNTHN